MLAGKLPEALVLRLVLDLLGWRLTRRLLRRPRLRRHGMGASVAQAPNMGRQSVAV